MAARTRAQLKSDATTRFADNTSGDISEGDLRGFTDDVADSALLPEDVATTSEFRGDTAGNNLLTAENVWDAAELATLTDGATISVNFAAGFNFGGASNAVLALGGNRSLGAPSNVKTGQSGVLWFGASGSTRTLTLNAAWLLLDGVEAGPYSITTSQILGVAYVTRGTAVYVTGILRRAA